MNISRRSVMSAFNALTLALIPIGLAAQQTSPVASPSASPIACPVGIRVIGQQVLPNDLTVDDTLVGGLSGIDYDEANDTWYVLSDDRSDEAPARFYSADIAYTESSFDGVTIQQQTTLLQSDGSVYPNEEEGGNIPDPESIRVDPLDPGVLWYTSEGNYDLDLDPFVASTTADGEMVSQLPLSERYQTSSGEELGPRNNLVFEGMDFSEDGESLWIALEGPLYQDSDLATVETGAVNRIVNLDRDGTVLAEYAYELDPLPADPGELFGTTGVTEILSVDDTRFLVIERATVQNEAEEYINYIKVYMIDTGEASDVKDVDALAGGDFVPVTKTLVFDMNACGMDPIDNMEGLTWGPELENGNPSLVMVSDNNFNDTQVQLFVALELTVP